MGRLREIHVSDVNRRSEAKVMRILTDIIEFSILNGKIDQLDGF